MKLIVAFWVRMIMYIMSYKKHPNPISENALLNGPISYFNRVDEYIHQSRWRHPS